jgi:hypothetical protein
MTPPRPDETADVLVWNGTVFTKASGRPPTDPPLEESAYPNEEVEQSRQGRGSAGADAGPPSSGGRRRSDLSYLAEAVCGGRCPFKSCPLYSKSPGNGFF